MQLRWRGRRGLLSQGLAPLQPRCGQRLLARRAAAAPKRAVGRAPPAHQTSNIDEISWAGCGSVVQTTSIAGEDCMHARKEQPGRRTCRPAAAGCGCALAAAGPGSCCARPAAGPGSCCALAAAGLGSCCGCVPWWWLTGAASTQASSSDAAQLAAARGRRRRQSGVLAAVQQQHWHCALAQSSPRACARAARVQLQAVLAPRAPCRPRCAPSSRMAPDRCRTSCPAVWSAGDGALPRDGVWGVLVGLS